MAARHLLLVAVGRRDYSARELTVRSGMIVSGSLIESGWLWATTEEGTTGWVPLNVLEPCNKNPAKRA